MSTSLCNICYTWNLVRVSTLQGLGGKCWGRFYDTVVESTEVIALVFISVPMETKIVSYPIAMRCFEIISVNFSLLPSTASCFQLAETYFHRGEERFMCSSTCNDLQKVRLWLCTRTSNVTLGPATRWELVHTRAFKLHKFLQHPYEKIYYIGDLD